MKPATSIPFIFLLLFTSTAWAFSVSEPYLTICPSSTGVLELTHSQAGQFTIALEGEASRWATLTGDRISVANKPVITYLYVTIPSATETGVYPLDIISTSGEEVKKLSLDIKVDNCYRLALIPPAGEVAFCAGEQGKLDMTARNDGKFKESVRLYTDDWAELGEYSFDLLPDEEKTIPVFVSGLEAGTRPLNVRMESYTSAAKAEVALDVASTSCHKVTYTVPPTFEVCKDRNVFKAIKFRNEGTKDEMLTPEADVGWITPEAFLIRFPAGTEREVYYLIAPTVDVGEYEVNFKTFTDHERFDIPVKVIVKDCFAFDVSISPDPIEACPGESRDLKIGVKNIGEIDMNLTGMLVNSMDLTTETLELNVKAHEAGTVDSTIAIPADAREGEYPLAVGFTNMINSRDVKATVRVLPAKSCFGLRMYPDPEDISVLPETGEVVEIQFKNLGKVPAKYDLSVIGADWAMIRPGEVAVVPGDEVKAYLYVSPGLQTELGDYEVGVAATSEKSTGIAKVTVHVVDQLPAGPTGFAIARGPDFTVSQVGYFLAAIGIVLVLVLVGLIQFRPAT